MSHLCDLHVGLPPDTTEKSEYIAIRLGLRSYLIEGAHWSNENDSICVIKVRNPGVPLTTSAANVIQMPCDGFSMNCYVKDVFRNSHRLNPSMENIVFGNSVNKCYTRSRDCDILLTSGRDIVRGSYTSDVLEEAVAW